MTNNEICKNHSARILLNYKVWLKNVIKNHEGKLRLSKIGQKFKKINLEYDNLNIYIHRTFRKCERNERN